MPIKKASNPQRLFTKVGQITEKAMTEILAVIDAQSAQYVPIDTAALINSRFRRVETTATGIVGTVGYTQAYAAALHERTDWKPKPPNTPGKKGGGFNPDATHHFLSRGVEESRAMIKKIIEANYANI
jgi:hypothetical protein